MSGVIEFYKQNRGATLGEIRAGVVGLEAVTDGEIHKALIEAGLKPNGQSLYGNK